MDVLRAKSNYLKQERRTAANLAWEHGKLVSYAVWDTKNYPDLWEAFPNLFEHEETWQEIKEKMSAYVAAKRQVNEYNSRRA